MGKDDPGIGVGDGYDNAGNSTKGIENRFLSQRQNCHGGGRVLEKRFRLKDRLHHTLLPSFWTFVQ